MNVFRLTMLPAREGDCLILSFGADEAKLSHVVIDGGRKATWPHLKAALQAIADRGEEVELLLLSHIDADHIDGLLEMAEADDLPLAPKAVWYNSHDQLRRLIPPGAPQPKGVRVADLYTKALAARGWALNEAFGGKAILIEGQPDPFEFAGLKLTLVSPDRRKLMRLWTEWEEWRDTHPAAGLRAKAKRVMPAVLDVETLSAPSPTDSTPPNGSSIAFIAEYAGRRVLLGADAHPDVVVPRIEALAGGAGKTLAIDLVKLPHHASRANVTRELVERIACNRFAISTSGAVFGHPDPEAIARVLQFGQAGAKTLYCNYASDRTKPWDDAALKAKWNYTCEFSAAPDTGIVIDI